MALKIHVIVMKYIIITTTTITQCFSHVYTLPIKETHFTLITFFLAASALGAVVGLFLIPFPHMTFMKYSYMPSHCSAFLLVLLLFVVVVVLFFIISVEYRL